MPAKSKDDTGVDIQMTSTRTERNWKRPVVTVFAALLVIMIVLSTGVYNSNDLHYTILPRPAFVNSYRLHNVQSSVFGDHEDAVENSTSDATVYKHAPKRFISNVGFLKVHKAGSSTVTNLLFRFVLRHELTTAVPKNTNFLTSKSSAMPLRNTSHFYDVLACHTTYSKVMYDNVVSPVAAKIAIVREPLSRAISAAYYYRDKFRVRYLMKVPKEALMKNLMAHPDIYETKKTFSFTKNCMAQDFGFSVHKNQTSTQKIKEYLAFLNVEFTLVLIMEKFDESLVLMKRILNWSLEDIIYLPSNSHPHKNADFTDSELKKFRQTNFLDYAIYEYFTEQLEKKVQLQSSDFNAEVDYYKTVVERARVFCDTPKTTDKIVITKSEWNTEFAITKHDCQHMKVSVLDFLDLLRRRHTEKHF